MTRKTEIVGRSLSQTMVQGLKALGGKEVPNYTLLFLDQTADKKKGEFQPIVVPFIEIGRGSSCVIQYGDEFPTVSRVHCTLSREGAEVVLRHVGKNPTLVNGNPIGESWFLKNGDEIQLSNEGPRIRFNSTPTKTSTMNFTQRFGLFAQQALKPYKTAVLILSLLLLGTIAFTIYQKIDSDKKLHDIDEKYSKELALKQQELQVLKDKQSSGLAEMNRLKQSGQANSSRFRQLQYETSNYNNKISSLNAQIEKINETKELALKNPTIAINELPITKEESAPTAEVNTSELDNLASDVYYVCAMSIEVSGEKEPAQILDGNGNPMPIFTGTAFLTTDAKLITARHVVFPWRFFKGAGNEAFEQYNKWEQEGRKITVSFKGYSSNGKTISFTSNEFNVKDESDDKLVDGIKLSTSVSTDWTYLNFNRAGKIIYDKNKSENLKKLETLYTINYSLPAETQPKNGSKLEPLITTTTTTQNGLVNETINVSNRNFEEGSSGGPVFYNDNGKFVVVGIISAGRDNLGKIIPISNIR